MQIGPQAKVDKSIIQEHVNQHRLFCCAHVYLLWAQPVIAELKPDGECASGIINDSRVQYPNTLVIIQQCRGENQKPAMGDRRFFVRIADWPAQLVTSS